MFQHNRSSTWFWWKINICNACTACLHASFVFFHYCHDQLVSFRCHCWTVVFFFSSFHQVDCIVSKMESRVDESKGVRSRWINIFTCHLKTSKSAVSEGIKESLCNNQELHGRVNLFHLIGTWWLPESLIKWRSCIYMDFARGKRQLLLRFY